ncbi:unnamed protein product [Linum trigynum]|uniref:Protein kinase domain-containing protein n=3 Tax=Linum TaxID=4005 RepID=A0AAV2G344_9ROSI
MPSRSILSPEQTVHLAASSESPSPVFPPSPSPLLPHHRLSSRQLLPPLAAATTTVAFSFLLIFAACFRKLTQKRTVPSDSKPPHRFPHSTLRRATNNFSPALRLGQGGFGSVFRATLPDGQLVAVKLMDSGSLQGEREFQNELFFASKLESPHAVTAMGFSADRRRRAMLLVYELMPNGNLQDALLHRKCPELFEWKQRFSVAVDVAKGLEYLHSLDPPVIHGDVKPSNVLLDQFFSARIADFGLAWSKAAAEEGNQGNPAENRVVLEKRNGESEMKKVELEAEDCGSVMEAESVTTAGFEEFGFGVDQSPESVFRGPVSLTSPETAGGVSLSPETVGVPISPPTEVIMDIDKVSVASGKEAGEFKKSGKASKSGKDWWWKQDNGVPASAAGAAAPVKDYVMEWIGTEIKRETPSSEWISSSTPSTSNQPITKTSKKKEQRKRLDWWVSLDEEKEKKILKKERKRAPREWWKEEYCEELEKKKRKQKKKEREMGIVKGNSAEDWWPAAGDGEESYTGGKKKRKKNSSHDWFSGELFRGRFNSHDSLSGDIAIPKSGGVSSTPSMRGTVCYVAPEYGGGGDLSEKSDVYSFGVLLLVVMAGRRPLQVTNSPMSEFQRANLIHWARNLARAGKLIDLVDGSIRGLDREQATLCVTVALLCLQKSPAARPSMKEVVGMLSGGVEVPALPIEFSPSPPSRVRFKSKQRKKGSLNTDKPL